MHFAFLGPESQWAAEASECAAEQGAFWPYHDLLFTRQKGENQLAFSKENLKKFAAELSLELGAFNSCVDSGKHANQVQAETQAGQAIGIYSTPSFFINGKPLVGAQPFELMAEYIDGAQ